LVPEPDKMLDQALMDLFVDVVILFLDIEQVGKINLEVLI